MSGLREAFEQLVEDVPVYGDLQRAIEQAEQEDRRRLRLVAGVAAAAVLILIAGLIRITGDDRDDSQQPTDDRTGIVDDDAGWEGALRDGTSWRLDGSGSDSRDAAVGWVDIRGVDGTFGETETTTVSPQGPGSELVSPGRWRIELWRRPPATGSLETGQRVLEYGVVVDGDGDKVADCQIGINDDTPQPDAYRVWVTNLKSGRTDERVGAPYGYPIDFAHPADDALESPMLRFFFLPVVVGSEQPGSPPSPCRPFGRMAQFYVWAVLTEDGQVTAWDYAPDSAWLELRDRSQS